MILSVDTEKAFEKILYPLMIQTLSKLCIERNFLNLITKIYKKPTTNLRLNGEKLEAFLLRLEITQRCLLSHSYSASCWKFKLKVPVRLVSPEAYLPTYRQLAVPYVVKWPFL